MPKKFDVVIGNPPYQEDVVGETNRAEPLYNRFMDAAYAIADRVVLITPARFLSDAGQTPKAWNKKMLADKHLSVAHFQANSDDLFPGTVIKGGVAVTYRDATKVIGPIGTFTSHEEVGSILAKVTGTGAFVPLSTVVSSRALYRYSDLAMSDHSDTLGAQSAGIGTQVTPSNFITFTGTVFFETQLPGIECIAVAGLENGRRIRRWIRRDYLNQPSTLNQWKVLVAKANNSGAFGETLASPFVGEPGLAHTDTFMTIGGFGTKNEAQAALAYLKSKFARTLLSILKTTQNNPKSVWRHVPLQDFTATSDIDWTQPIPAIDQQLYKKYGLSDDEIAFIETHVKSMD